MRPSPNLTYLTKKREGQLENYCVRIVVNKKNSFFNPSLLDNAPNYVVGYIIQKRQRYFCSEQPQSIWNVSSTHRISRWKTQNEM